jgi:cobalt-zinc-cadmium efflux system protein
VPHDHAHHHAGASDGNIAWAVAVNVILGVAQVVGGLIAGSVALIADAVHNLSDAMTLVLAYVARRIARRPVDAAMTFGYGRAEVVAALINYSALIVVAGWLAVEGLSRLFNPPEVQGGIVVALAALALVVDLATVALTWREAKHSMNIRAAYLHNVADAASSVVVIVAGGLILLFGWRWVDPLATLGIAAWMLWQALHEIGPAIRILMLGAPPGIAADEVLALIAAVEGVDGVHHLHLWQIDEHDTSLEAHLVVTGDGVEASARVRAMLDERFGIHHATLAVEVAGGPCGEKQAIGCAAE